MNTRDRLGGIIHTYQKYDPINFPAPAAPPPDLATPAMEHLLFYGNTRKLTEEELARAVQIEYAALNLSATSKLRFRHMLDGAEAEWVYDADSRRATYANLRAGDYRFRVSTTEAPKKARGAISDVLLPYAPFRFQGAAVDSFGNEMHPDKVLWHGGYFLVRMLDDYTPYGRGFTQAVATSIQAIDLPPAGSA